MRMRSLSVSVLAALVLIPVGGSAALASTSGTLSTTSRASHLWKNSATKRAAFVGPVATAARIAPRTATVVTAPAKTYEGEVLRLTNIERTMRGLRPLVASTCAGRYADTWSVALSVAGALSHQSLLPIMRTCGARGAGENVAYGNVTPAQLVTMWMNSSGHRANILNPAYTHVGIGAVTTAAGRTYGVQDFLTV